MTSRVDARLKELGLELPPPPVPAANYVTFVRSGDLVFTSGHGPLRADGSWMTGRVGADVDAAWGVQAAQLTCLNLLATLRAELGSLDRVRRIVKVFGMVNCVPEFGQHPSVINGCSDLIVAVFGDAGRHARSAVGMGSLPFGITVEIELIAEVT
jgi:enamine deaminase RidA (YjgF/YER057c/UK114 family)